LRVKVSSVRDRSRSIRGRRSGQRGRGGDYRGQFDYARLLLEAGQPEDALDWFARSVEAAVPAFCREAARGLGGNPHPALRAIALRPCSASESGEAHDVRAYAAALADGLAGVPDPEEACLQICVRTKI
jgi:hypothetical protein